MSKPDPGDIAAMTGPSIKIKSAEQFKELAQQASAKFNGFETDMILRMTPERAIHIRKIRIDDGYSWRAVASECFKQWGDDANWEPSSNQLAGMALCKLSAMAFGEDFYDENTWN